MAPLSNATYGKDATMDFATIADRITAALDELRGALDGLRGDAETGAPVNQAHVNTIDKTMGALGDVATDVRQAGVDDAQAKQDADADAKDSAPASHGDSQPESGSASS